MRYLIAGLFAGLLVGALAPIPFVFGHDCDDVVDNAHSSQSTCCGCSYEDNTVDEIENTESGLYCIIVENCNFCHTTQGPIYAPSQCQTHGTNDKKSYTVFVKRNSHCVPTNYFTDVRVNDVDCNDFHGHVYTDTCGGCGA